MTYLLFDYIKWHYGRSIKEGYLVFTNFVWFVLNFFSIKILFETFFDRFERLGDDGKSRFGAKTFFEKIIVNTLMRIVGMFVRTLFIIAGIVCLSVVFLAFACIIVVWTILPILLPVSLIFSLIFLI